MKILVTGVNGQLGHDVVKRLEALGMQAIPADVNVFDITDENAVNAFFESKKPDAVIHCAAYTAVDKAESECEKCYAVNVLGTMNIAAAAEKAGAKIIYISSDYVFGAKGEKVLETSDRKSPLNHYGVTKLSGENAVIEKCSKAFVVRTSWVFGANGANFVKTMLRLGKERSEISVVDDQVGSPTYTKDLAVLLCEMVRSTAYGIYHATNEDYCSWAEFAKEIMSLAGLECTVKPIKTSEYPTDARRPLNSRLSKASLDEAGFERLPCWQDALKRYMEETGELKA